MREAGKVVCGVTERKTPEPFIAACDKFIFFDVLGRPEAEASEVRVADLSDLKELLLHAVNETSHDNSWSSLSAVARSSTITTHHSMRASSRKSIQTRGLLVVKSESEKG